MKVTFFSAHLAFVISLLITGSLLHAKVDIIIIMAISKVPMLPNMYSEATTATLSDLAVAISSNGIQL